MTMSPWVALLSLSIGLAFSAGLRAAEDAIEPASTSAATLPADVMELRAQVAELDRRMFDAYNSHDLERLMAMFAPDLEFFHDTGGLLGYEQVKAGFASVFANSPDIRRDLVPGSLEVYPIKGYGAIQVGAHTFCHTENGAPSCGTFRFMQVWRLADGQWKVTRDVSYGH
jgi:ketosteroid isomerase-like protein